MVEIIDFTEDEKAQMQDYIVKNVENTILTRLYPLSENPEDKSTNFVLMYRILESCMNYASTTELKNKLKDLLLESEDIYNEIYPIILEYSNKKSEFGKSYLFRKIILILQNREKNIKINKIVDAFLIFGEKIELLNINAVMGLDLESDYGKETLKDLKKVIEKEKI